MTSSLHLPLSSGSRGACEEAILLAPARSLLPIKGEFRVNPGHPRDWAAAWPVGDALMSAAAQACPFDRAAWLALVADHFRGHESLRLLLAGQDSPELVLPLTARGWGRFEAFACYYNFRVAPIFAPGTGLDRQAALLNAVAAALPGWQLVLAPMAAADADAVAAAFAPAGWRAVREPEPGNMVLDVAGHDFASYWAGRPGLLRSTARRKAKAHGLEIRIHDWFDAGAWADYVAVYADSWKEAEGSFAFLEAFARSESAAGRLRLGIARHGGVAVAAQLWTIDHGTALIHKLAYREAARSLSAGTVLSAAMFERAIDGDGAVLIDYGKGEDGYKRDWVEQCRPQTRLTLVRPAHPLGTAWLLKRRLMGGGSAQDPTPRQPASSCSSSPRT